METRSPKWKKRPPMKPEMLTQLLAELGDLTPAPSALVLQLLWNREHKSAEAMRAFLTAGQAALPDPLTLVGMDAAVATISAAIDAGERIAVWGDFDADGVTAVTLLTQALRAFGAQAEPYVPHRLKEGYGLNTAALTELAKSGVKLVITVDCGISNRDEALHAKDAGLKLVITDHHNTSHDIPEAEAVINPKIELSNPDFATLAGVGVAHQVVRALVAARGKPAALRNADLLELVAVGTVADMAGLIGANRTLVTLGLACLNITRRPGLVELLKVARHSGPITAHTIGFIIGPRLNAVGRLDDARWAYELLLTPDPRRAAELATKLEEENRKRVAATKAGVEQARAIALGRDDSEKMILVRHPAWEPGVVGLIAGRLAEEFHRPTVAIAERDGTSRGSARSPMAFDIYEALSVCRDNGLFDGGRMGGHAKAAGFTIRTELLDDLHEQLLEMAEAEIDEDALAPELKADAELSWDDLTLLTLDSISALEPFGMENDAPLFVARSLRVLDAVPFSEGSPHLRLRLGPASAAAEDKSGLEAAYFSSAAEWARPLAAHPLVDVMFALERHTWKEETTLRLMIKALRVSKTAA